MLIRAESLNPSPFCLTRNVLHSPVLIRHPHRVSSSNGFRKAGAGRRNLLALRISASWGNSESISSVRKRKVVEHVTLIKAKESISDEEEKDMLDYLYTTQYQMGGIVAISLGRVSDQNIENFTHIVYMRFQRKDNLEKFYGNSFYTSVLNKHVMPYCHGLIHADYESEVEDDILPLFRKGEEFNYGVELVLLISFVRNAFGAVVEDALASLDTLADKSPSLIVQSTHGLNFNLGSKEFTHVVVIRFRSVEAFQIFTSNAEYKDLWSSKFEPITERTVSLHFSVNPVGTEIM